MTRRWMLLVALLATAAWSGSALALFHDYFPDGADGSFDANPPGEGYGDADETNFRLAKYGQHFGFLDFRTEYSDGPDGLREGFSGDHNDGYLLGDPASNRGGVATATSPAWYAGKKIVSAWLYIRDNDNGCNGLFDGDGSSLDEPVQVLGFRCGNNGPFNDRGWWYDTNALDANGDPNPTYDTWIHVSGDHVHNGGCCGFYNNASVIFGEMAPPAWRMGPFRTYTGGTLAYNALGDIGDMTPIAVSPTLTVTPEYWKVSVKDTNSAYAGQSLVANTAPFSDATDISSGTAIGGYAGSDTNLFGLGWLIRHSTAHLINSVSMTKASCSDPYGPGKTNPRAMGTSAGTSNWFAVPIDPVIIQALAAKADVAGGASDAAGGAKGIVFSAYDSVSGTTSPDNGAGNYNWNARDQGGDRNSDFCPYLDLRATYAGDVNNDGMVNVVDLQKLVAAWNSAGNPVTGASASGSYNVQADFTLDGFVNVGDLQLLVNNWGKTAPNQ